MARVGITHILSVGTRPKNIPNGATTLYIEAKDRVTQDIGQILPEAVAFITDALQSGGVILVHCLAGVSRSSSCVIAYLMTKMQIDFETALAMVKAKRKKANPNDAFVR